jgi:pilus assembly protein CpaF
MNFLLEQLPDASYRRHFEKVLNLLSLTGVTDVVCNGPSEWWVDRGRGLEPVRELSVPELELQEMARFLVGLGDRHLDLISPVTDAAISVKNLPALAQLGIDRLRVHAVLASEISEQTLLSIRVHRAARQGLDELAEAGLMSFAQFGRLREILNARANFVISGPTGSGKTTLLRAMIAESPQLRTVVVEDTFEILPVAGQVVGLQVRQPNSDGAGELDLALLAREALRMRPDRLVVGEVRGSEVDVLLKAMNTGHRGSAASLHANSAFEVPARMLSLALQAGHSRESFYAAAEAAIDFVIHLDFEGGVRKVTQIEEWGNVSDASQ